MKQTILNINSRVKVKLTPVGFKKWKQSEDEFLSLNQQQSIDHYTNRADEKGYVDFMLWQLMETFGPGLVGDCFYLNSITFLTESIS